VNFLLAARLLVGNVGLVLYGSRLTGTPQEMLRETLIFSSWESRSARFRQFATDDHF